MEPHGSSSAAAYPVQFDVEYLDRALNRLTTEFRNRDEGGRSSGTDDLPVRFGLL